jgi:guanylate kinase
LQTAELELAAQQEFEHVIVNDELESAAAKLEGIVREELERDP